MNPQNPPPQLLLHVQSTIQILKQTTTVVFFTRHHFIISLLLSLLLLSYKLGAEFMTRHFYTSIDYDPSIQTYFAQIHNPPKPTNTTHLPGAGDFDSEISYQFFNDRPTIPQTPNATPFTFDSYIPRLGLSRPKKLIFKLIMTQEKVNASLEIDYGTQNDQDLTLYLCLHLLARYVATFLGFLFTRCCVHGVIFVLLVNALLRIHNPIFATFRRGTELGLRRLLEYTAVKCMIRHSLIHFLAVYFLGEMKDPHTGYMVFVRLNFMPFSISFYPVEGFEEEVEFLVWWFFLEMLLSSVFAMCACAFMVDETRTWWDRLREVCNLLSLNVFPVIWFKFLEIICGSIARFVSEQIVGELFGFGMQFFVEVYFRVALMMYYFSVKSRDANRRGEPFGRREFEDMLIGI